MIHWKKSMWREEKYVMKLFCISKCIRLSFAMAKQRLWNISTFRSFFPVYLVELLCQQYFNHYFFHWEGFDAVSKTFKQSLGKIFLEKESCAETIVLIWQSILDGFFDFSFSCLLFGQLMGNPVGLGSGGEGYFSLLLLINAVNVPWLETKASFTKTHCQTNLKTKMTKTLIKPSLDANNESQAW